MKTATQLTYVCALANCECCINVYEHSSSARIKRKQPESHCSQIFWNTAWIWPIRKKNVKEMECSRCFVYPCWILRSSDTFKILANTTCIKWIWLRALEQFKIETKTLAWRARRRRATKKKNKAQKKENTITMFKCMLFKINDCVNAMNDVLMSKLKLKNLSLIVLMLMFFTTEHI